MSPNRQNWQEFAPRLKVYDELPTPVFMKSKDMPSYSKVIDHQHNWDQLIYSKSGVLEVNSEKGDYIIPPLQAVWIPANRKHSIATINGAQLRSVHINKGLINSFNYIQVLKVNKLVQALIHTASKFKFNNKMQAQETRLLKVLIDQIASLPKVDLCLPLSNDPLIFPILSWQQLNLDSNKTLNNWAVELGASSKTISRRFESLLGMSFSQWREQLKLHKTIQWLYEKRPVTQIALDLGYESLPAFIQMFKRNMGVTPGKFKQND
jgi:AraC-like DNA-binding protein